MLATHSIRQFSFHFPSCASPCAITFHLDSNMGGRFWKQIASNKFIPSWEKSVLAFSVTEDLPTY